MVKKLYPQPELQEDIAVIGIACSLRDYRMSFYLNQKLHTRFRKLSDLNIQTRLREENYPFYAGKLESSHHDLFLLSNRNGSGHLFSEIKNLDYLIILSGPNIDDQSDLMVRYVRSVPHILMAQKIDAVKLKNLDLVLEDLEIHLLELDRPQKERIQKFKNILKQQQYARRESIVR